MTATQPEPVPGEHCEHEKEGELCWYFRDCTRVMGLNPSRYCDNAGECEHDTRQRKVPEGSQKSLLEVFVDEHPEIQAYFDDNNPLYLVPTTPGGQAIRTITGWLRSRPLCEEKPDCTAPCVPCCCPDCPCEGKEGLK